MVPNTGSAGAWGLRTLVVGAGSAGSALARDLLHTPEFGLRPVGFLDDDPGKDAVPVAGAEPASLPVLGRLDDLTAVSLENGVEVVALAIPGLEHEVFRKVVAAASAVGANVRYLPSFLVALQRDVVGSDMRTLDVNRLIGRQELHVVSASVREVIAGRRVLVTGAGGSIGSELCRQVYGFGPSRLYMLDHDESNLHRLQLDVWGEALLDDDALVIADIRDRPRIEQLFRDLKPDVVFHAAAHKHLPLLERHPCEAVKSNVLGTENLVRASLEAGVERFILISTDKAADPASVLGATKRLAELIVQANTQVPGVFAGVRFGNVLGSRGSLLTVLAEQVRSGGPVTVTHPDVTRFFMTIEEAVGLVLEAGRMAQGGEIFVLDMGSPVRIVDLVHKFVDQVNLPALRGLPDLPQVDIRFTGLRPGEKLNEALFAGDEERLPTEHPRIQATVPPGNALGSVVRLSELYEAAAANDDDATRELLGELLPGYAGTAPAPAAGAFDAPYPDDF